MRLGENHDSAYIPYFLDACAGSGQSSSRVHRKRDAINDVIQHAHNPANVNRPLTSSPHLARVSAEDRLGLESNPRQREHTLTDP